MGDSGEICQPYNVPRKLPIRFAKSTNKASRKAFERFLESFMKGYSKFNTIFFIVDIIFCALQMKHFTFYTG